MIKMKKLEKLMKMNMNPIVENIFISKRGEEEYYIDERTIKNEQGMKVVKPVAENEMFVWYICPFCQQIHIESKRCLNVNNKVIMTNCKYRYRIMQYIIIDCEIEPVAFQEAKDDVLEKEYEFMMDFEN